MERWHKVVVAVIGVLVLMLASFSFGYAVGGRAESLFAPSTGQGLNLVDDAFRRIRSEAMNPPSPDELAQGAVRGMVRVLNKSGDRYALFYSPRSYRAFEQFTSGHFSGIGVWLRHDNGALQVVSVLPSTPAVDAGLREGDVIRTINGEDVRKMTVDEAVNLIKGPPGSKVSLTIERNGAVHVVSITRAAIELPDLAYRMTAGRLGYIHLYAFSQGAGAQVRSAVRRLLAKGAKGVIFDLRDNGGGLVSEAINVASIFLEDGKILTYKQGSSPGIVYKAKGDAFDRVPLVVLVNGATASASEIVAGALQDRNRAVLVGTTTYGKGVVQQVVPLADAAAFKLTTGAYFTPSGRNINGKGIKPDVEVKASPAVQKQRAIQVLKGIVVSMNNSHA
jgi:carboxyl-terminal processing protease